MQAAFPTTSLRTLLSLFIFFCLFLTWPELTRSKRLHFTETTFRLSLLDSGDRIRSTQRREAASICALHCSHHGVRILSRPLRRPGDIAYSVTNLISFQTKGDNKSPSRLLSLRWRGPFPDFSPAPQGGAKVQENSSSACRPHLPGEDRRKKPPHLRWLRFKGGEGTG